MSVSTAKPNKLDDLIRVARKPHDLMGQKVEGVLASQVSVDRERNTVVVWVTLEKREPLYVYLASEEGKRDHEGEESLSEIIESFAMYEMTPISGKGIE
jgi:hypothetical protein